MRRILLNIWFVIWTSPNTTLGMLIGFVGLLSGGKVRCRDGAIEFHSGGVAKFLRLFPVRPIAMTLGHTILGQTEQDLDSTSYHERVHVRQYSYWGPFFLPAYFFASFLVWTCGQRAYRDNPFEIQAYDETDLYEEGLHKGDE